jgi:hypothetical protein
MRRVTSRFVGGGLDARQELRELTPLDVVGRQIIPAAAEL